jgi:hypothetical protein
MAKAKSIGNSQKTSFGKRRSGPGSGTKSYGPKAQKPKKYRGQGKIN